MAIRGPDARQDRQYARNGPNALGLKSMISQDYFRHERVAPFSDAGREPGQLL